MKNPWKIVDLIFIAWLSSQFIFGTDVGVTVAGEDYIIPALPALLVLTCIAGILVCKKD